MRLTWILFVFFLAAASARAEPAGIVTRLQGMAEAGPAGQFTPLGLGSPVEIGWELRTGEGARLEIRFADDTRLTLGENTLMIVDAFVYRPMLLSGDVSFGYVKGAFLVVSGGIASLPGKPLKVTTPVATIGIRGTTFWGGSLDALLDIMVLDGQVVVSNKAGSVEIATGEGTSLPAIGSRAFPVIPQPPPPPSRWAAERVARAIGTVSFR